MERKYLFFDIDGTLTDRATGKIVPSAKEALQRLEENGHFVAIATGRAHYKAEKFTKANGFKNMVCNGGNGLVINGELVMNIPLLLKRQINLAMDGVLSWMIQKMFT